MAVQEKKPPNPFEGGTTLDIKYRTVGRILLVVGGLVLAGFVVFVIDAVQFLSVAKGADGTVIEIKYKEEVGTNDDGEKVGAYYPVVEFEADGRKTTFTSGMGGGETKYSVGEEVDVLYWPDDPKDARINSFFGMYLMPLVFLAAGALLIFMGIKIKRVRLD